MNLFTPFATLNLKNRAVMAPMTRYHCTAEGTPTEDLIAYYAERAKNEVGLVIVESCAINGTDARGYVNGAALHSEKQMEEWRKLVKEVHKEGAKIWIQLFHAGRLTVKEITKSKVVAPSALSPVPSKSFWRPLKDDQIVHFQTQTPYATPIALTEEEIQNIISQFAYACELAEKAGFDGVELHGAHGYLVHQFCHVSTNQRTDKYRAKDFNFIKELISTCKSAVSTDFTLAYRLSVHMVDNSYVRYAEADMNYEQLVKVLDAGQIDIFHCSEMNAGSKMFGAKESLHELVRRHTDKPIIVCGRINNLEKANKLLNNGQVDLVAIGRALISNPQLISNFKQGIDFDFIEFDYGKHIELIA